MVPVLLKAGRIALVVGTLLTLINQWDALFGPNPIRWIPLALTYMVPFCVYLYGFWSHRRMHTKGKD